jgi:hypothetical protein
VHVPYLQVHFCPGGTSGPAEGGHLTSVFWDSKDQSEDFMENTLLPALPVEGGFVGAPTSAPPPSPTTTRSESVPDEPKE